MNNLTLNWSVTPEFVPVDSTVVTTQQLLDLCGQMDSQAIMMAWLGLGLALLAMYWFGRLRLWLTSRASQLMVPVWFVPATDKFMLTMMAMCFVIIIVRLLRAG